MNIRVLKAMRPHRQKVLTEKGEEMRLQQWANKKAANALRSDGRDVQGEEFSSTRDALMREAVANPKSHGLTFLGGERVPFEGQELPPEETHAPDVEGERAAIDAQFAPKPGEELFTPEGKLQEGIATDEEEEEEEEEEDDDRPPGYMGLHPDEQKKAFLIRTNAFDEALSFLKASCSCAGCGETIACADLDEDGLGDTCNCYKDENGKIQSETYRGDSERDKRTDEEDDIEDYYKNKDSTYTKSTPFKEALNYLLKRKTPGSVDYGDYITEDDENQGNIINPIDNGESSSIYPEDMRTEKLPKLPPATVGMLPCVECGKKEFQDSMVEDSWCRECAKKLNLQ